MNPEIELDFPGADLVEKGLADLAADIRSVEACLVAIGAPRLRHLGLEVPERRLHPEGPEHALYALLESEHKGSAHSRYNALVRRLVSFERALATQQAASRRIV